MTKARCLFVLFVAASFAAGCRILSAPPAPLPTDQRPSLIVLVAIDQLRPDMIDRYDVVFTGGIRRLLDEGYRFSNATQDHAETSTAPGHATLATGVYPSRHGIVANNWSELVDGAWDGVYCVEDLDAEILGFPGMPGRSPRNFYRDGLADWVVEADPDARIVSISRKDRGAIGLSAKAVGDVYWIPSTSGRFITSDFYRSEYPDWVERFNEEEMPTIYSESVWESRIPSEQRLLSRPDTSAFELDGEHTFFPHLASDRYDASDPGQVNRWRYDNTPFPDLAVTRLAIRAIQELDLGQRASLDYLGLSLSQTDLVGHRFGPFSREQMDNLLRLDAALGELLASLDREVGAGRWILALSADHGVLEIPEHMTESGRTAGRLARSDRDTLEEAVFAALETGAEGPALESAVRASVSSLPFIAGAYTFAELEATEAQADSFALFFGRSHVRDRVVGPTGRYGVMVRYPPNTLDWGGNRASHGSPYLYDRAVPLIFLGGMIGAGRSTDRASTTDVAPTLASLAGLAYPSDLDGRDLSGNLRP